MRLKIAIILAVLGLLALGSGIAQRTIWLPPETVTASVPAGVTPAPLTVIGPDVLKTRDGHFTMTIKGSGPIQLAVGRMDDIVGWIGDAAYTTVGAANEDFTALSSESKSGAETVPNPAGSDMWVTEEKATGEMSYTWAAPGHGDWALLLSSDGKAAAPSDISLTVDNEAGTPWAVPLMIIGSALLALAALLFLMAPRNPQASVVAVGRRSAVRPADPATGALEVEKILAAREGATTAGPGHTTIADVKEAEKKAAESDKPTEASAGPEAAAKPAVDDATSALPLSLRGEEAPASKDNASASDGEPESGEPGSDASPSADKPAETEKSDDGKNDGKNDDKGAGSGSSGPYTSEGPDTSSNSAAPALGKKSESAPKKPRKPRTPKKSGASEFAATTTKKAAPGMTMKARWGAALAAVLVAGTVSPAIAADETTPAPTPAVTSEASATPTTAAPSAGFPNLVDSQVQRIATAVATVVASGDNAKNAKELESRVAGMALEVRTANYRIRAAVESQAPVEPVNASKLLAKVVTTTQTWPRSAMFVTQGENNSLPQLLTLVQQSPRENYKLIKATPLLPGQTFPTVDKEGTKEVALNDGAGLKMSPEAAISALSDRLTHEDSKFKDTFKDSVYITSVFDLQKKVVADAKDATHVFSHTANTDSVVSVRTADGGALVVVGYNFSIDVTSKEDATLGVDDVAAVFTGGKETTTGFVLNYAEPVVMYVPPATGDAQITILSATRDLVGGAFK